MRPIPSFQPAFSFSELFRALACVRGRGLAERFEERFARYLPVNSALYVPSARWGLYLLLRGAGGEEGDEVIVPSYTYFAVPAAVVAAGMRPVFVDISPDDVSMDTAGIERKITARTKAIIATHLHGFPCGIERITAIAEGYGIRVIEDCAQSLGAAVNGKKTGTWGHAAYFSFSLTKNLTLLGGGMVVTSDDGLAQRIREEARRLFAAGSLPLLPRAVKAGIMKTATSRVLFPAVWAGELLASSCGLDIVDMLFREKPVQLGKSPAGALDASGADLGAAQLRDLDARNGERAKIGRALYGRLAGVPGVRLPRLREDAHSVFTGCPVFVDDRDGVRLQLLTRGIDTSSGYVQDCSGSGAFAPAVRSPHAARAESSVLHLPCYPGLSDADIRHIAEQVRSAAGKKVR